jgi:multiple sugar transport system substrate-binding protein
VWYSKRTQRYIAVFGLFRLYHNKEERAMAKNKRPLTRREFLRGVGLAGLGTALTAIGCQPKTVVVEKPVEVTKIVKETVVVEGKEVEVTKIVKETVVVKEEVEKVVTATPQPEQEGKLVWFALHGTDHLPPFREQKGMWRAMYPKVEIEELFVPWGQYNEKLTTMVAAGSPIDVVWFMLDSSPGTARDPVTWIEKDALLDFTPLFDDGTMEREDYFEGLLDVFTIDNKLWGTPFECWQGVLWYNKTLFDEAGLDIPDENWTWEDYRMAAEALTKVGDDGRPEQFGAVVPKWTTFAWQAGCPIVSKDGQQLILDSPEGREGLEEWFWYSSEGYAPVGDDTKVFGGLQTGKVATHSDGNYKWTSFRQVASELEFDFGATLAPAGPGPEPMNKANRAGYNLWSVFKSTQYPDLALKFAVHLGYGEGAEPWAATGRVSPLKRFDLDYYQEVAGLSEKEKEQYETVLNTTFTQMEKGYLHPNSVGLKVEGVPPMIYNGIYWDELNKVLIDKAQTLDEALKIAAERVAQAIKEATGG